MRRGAWLAAAAALLVAETATGFLLPESNPAPFYMVLKENGTTIGRAVQADFDDRFSIVCWDQNAGPCDTGELCFCTIGPGNQFTMAGPIDKSDVPATTAYEDEPNEFSQDQRLLTNLKLLFGTSTIWSVHTDGTNLIITRVAGSGVLSSAAPATLTGLIDVSGGGFIVPQGSGAPTAGRGRAYLRTSIDSGAAITDRWFVGDGAGGGAIALRERKVRAVLLSKGGADHCTGSAAPDACCTAAQTGASCTGQILPNGTVSGGVPNNWTAINFETETLDTDAQHTGGAASGVNQKITMNGALGPAAGGGGWFQYTCSLAFEANATGQRCVAITGDFFGTDITLAETCCPAIATSGAAAGTSWCTTTAVNNGAGSQSFKCWGWQSSGGNLKVLGAAGGPGINAGRVDSRFQVVFVGE